MKDRKDRAPIVAAGGIVLRGERKPRIAVVQLRKMDAWVLPKGKLADGEDAIAAARREVLEETGHRVSIHEFLGTLAYEAGGRPKVVQFWRMQALGPPVGELMRDVKAVEWLALDDALARLAHAREQAFLEQVGPIALQSAARLRRPAERPIRQRPSAGAVALAPAPVLMPAPLPAPVIRLAEACAPIDVTARWASPSSSPWPAPSATLAPISAAAANGHTNTHTNAQTWAEAVRSPAPETAPAVRSAFIVPRLPARIGGDATVQNGPTMLERAWIWLRRAAQPPSELSRAKFRAD